jgi:hypothetical protein
MSIQLLYLSLFSECTGMTVNAQTWCITCAPLSKGNALSPANRSLLATRLHHQHVYVHRSNSPIPSIGPSETYPVLGVELRTNLPSPMARHQTHSHIPHRNPSHPRPPHRQAPHLPACPMHRLANGHPRRSNISAPLCRDLDINSNMAIKPHPFFFDASVKPHA